MAETEQKTEQTVAKVHYSKNLKDLAQAFYDSQDVSILPALSDACEEEGLPAEFAEHFRDPDDFHPKGCWHIDEILGLE
jgi:hypothetical protein